MLRLATLRRLISFALGCASVAACGPEGATPVPEPPALQADKLFAPVSVASPGRATLAGSAGAAPPRSVIEIIALDSPEPPTATTAAQDGSFSVSVLPGELRAVAIVDGRRSSPLDFSLTGGVAVPSARLDCLRVAPALLQSAARGSATRFTMTNGCPSPVSLSNARTRTLSPVFVYDAALDTTLAVNASASISVSVAANANLTDQELLFVDVGYEGSVVRYPLGVYVSQ